MLLTVAAVLAKVGDQPVRAAFPCAGIHACEVLRLGRAVDELAWT